MIPGGLCPPSQGARVVCEGPGLVPAPGAEKHQPLPGVCPAGPLGRRGLGAATSTGAAGALSLLFVAFSLPSVRLSQTRGSGLGGGAVPGKEGCTVGGGGWVLALPFPEWVRHVRSHRASRSPRFSLCRSRGPREGESGRQARASGVPAAEGDVEPSVPCARGLRCVALRWQC